ncbi:MAG: hypothetical protein WD491_09880 [Balneolales bacterium]
MQFTPGAFKEYHSPIKENDSPQYSGNHIGSGECGSLVADQFLDMTRPEDDGDGQQKRQPEFVAEHLDAVAGVLIMITMPHMVMATMPVMSLMLSMLSVVVVVFRMIVCHSVAFY